MAVEIKARKPKAERCVNIQERRDFGNGIVLYTVLSSNGVDQHWTTLVNGAATGCTCRELPDGTISRHECYHMRGCTTNEQERSTDHQQHVADEISAPTCIKCWRLVKHVGDWCGC